MIILLSGTQSINKKFLARIVLANLNTFEYKGYTCDFSHSDIKIYDADGKLVFRPSTIEGGIVGKDEVVQEAPAIDQPIVVNLGEDDGIEDLLHSEPDVLEHFLALNKEIFEDGIKHNHFVNRFCSMDVDFGLTDTPRYLKENGATKLLHPHEFDDVVNNIKNSPYKTKVITGTFGNHFINKIKEVFADEEVHVINIIRNPSASWLLNKKPQSKWNSPGSPDLDEAFDRERFFQSSIVSSSTIKNPAVVTVRFEDMMQSGILTIAGVDIDVREDYRAYNKWLSNYESKIDILMSDEEFATFNDLALNYTFNDFYIKPDDIDEEIEYNMPRDTLLSKIAANFPKNLFADLGYEPLTKDEILKK